MDFAAYRQQLRIAEVCKRSGDVVGCEKALGEFLQLAYPTADSLYMVDHKDVYDDIAKAITELIKLLLGRQEYAGAAVEAGRVVGFFSGHNARLAQMSPKVRAEMLSTVARATREHTLRAQLFGAASVDFASLSELTEAARAKLGQSAGLFAARDYRHAHDCALEARRMAQQADSAEVEAQSVRMLSETFLAAKDTQGSLGVILEYLNAPKELVTDKSAIRSRAELTETLGARYLSQGDRASARAAFSNAAGLYARCGETAKANALLRQRR
ncbi:hypothetical protein QP027_10815 [Corynebacterium breve]|uniref:Tetratricopeptide repeat protein n=1 Tax=Corynebacterium breve TaxID=3049799 RepID=A0ABY8VFZ9_9CORY|nr:hypothetical protein [Corynebacterium breve]WIM67568.1 hypothetical protein QP027_10815 [Corynebacterium breve]